MTAGRLRILIIWLICVAAAAVVVARARYITDLSAFLPRKPTPSQQLLVDQLRDGPAARLILIAIEGGSAEARAKVSAGMARSLRRDAQFASVNNGETEAEQGTREFLFQHRYLLSDQVSAARFSAAGLHQAISDTIGDLASPSGLLFKSLLPRDPTGELPHIIDQLSGAAAPETRDGIWVAADGSRALAVAQTAALGSDTDAQERATAAIQSAFDAAVHQAAPAAAGVTLKMSGPGVFAVTARAQIEHAALRLSILSSLIIVTLLLAVYRSPTVLGLGLLPVASAAVLGIASVALGFGAVHGITLGFGITLIGESVDYSIYFFLQSGSGRHPDAADWKRRWWPTVRLGMLTSVCGFASLLPSGFPGLQQLGVYSISGLITAALVTRFVLPALQPRALAIRDVAPIGSAIVRFLSAGDGRRRLLWAFAALLAAAAVTVLSLRHASLWNRELSALSPVPASAQSFDAKLRADLGAADVKDLVVVSGVDLESALQGAERAVAALQALINEQVIASVDSPTAYLPSAAAQERRRGSLPGTVQLRENLRQATNGLPVRSERLQPFLEDVETARHGPLLTAHDLSGTAMNTGFESMILHQQARWNALLPLHGAHAGEDIPLARVAAALRQAGVANARVLDLKQESDSLYAQYLSEAIRLSLAGLAALTLLLLIALKSPLRVLRVLAPLLLSVLIVAAALSLCGVQFTILHLVGMLLIVAVGSNYALFFDRQAHAAEPQAGALTMASLLVANASTVIGFGLLSFSQVPVLVTLGTTVAPGTFFALLISALLSLPGMHKARMIWLPGAFNTPRDFVDAGFAAAVQRRNLPLALTFVDLSFEHLQDRSALARLRTESILPARRRGETVWLAGISLGGMLALDYAGSHGQDIDGLYLLAPYLGNRMLTREIMRAPGLAAWDAGELAERDEERRIWRYIQSRNADSLPLHLGFGRQDRFAPAQRLLAATLSPNAVNEIDGGHDWRTWSALWDNFLDSRLA